MKTRETFAAILTAWVGTRRLVDCAEVLGVSKTQLGGLMKGAHVPWSRTVHRWAPIIGRPSAQLVAIAERDRRLGKRRKLIRKRKPRARTVMA